MTTDPSTQGPPAWRVLLAFVLAPALAGLALAMAMPAYGGLPSLAERIWRTACVFTIVGAYPPTLLLGVPAYFLLRRRVQPTAWACALVGGVVAVVPWLLIDLLTGNPDNASIGGQTTVIDGARTAYGWWVAVQGALTIIGAGAVGGLLFWLIAVAGRRGGRADAGQPASGFRSSSETT